MLARRPKSGVAAGCTRHQPGLLFDHRLESSLSYFCRSVCYCTVSNVLLTAALCGNFQLLSIKHLRSSTKHQDHPFRCSMPSIGQRGTHTLWERKYFRRVAQCTRFSSFPIPLLLPWCHIFHALLNLFKRYARKVCNVADGLATFLRRKGKAVGILWDFAGPRGSLYGKGFGKWVQYCKSIPVAG